MYSQERWEELSKRDIYFHGHYYDSSLDIRMTRDGEFTEEELREIADSIGFDWDMTDLCTIYDIYESEALFIDRLMQIMDVEEEDI